MSRKKVKAERERTEREKLELFLDRCIELSQLEALQQHFGFAFGFKIVGTTMVEHKLDEPSDRDLRSVIGELRKFIMKDSDIFLNRIHGIVRKSLRPSEQIDKYRTSLDAMNQEWRNGFTRGMARITINGVVVTPEHAWETWINGKYLHDDMTYMKELNRLTDIFRESHRAQFLQAAIITLNYTKWLGRNVAFFLNTDQLDLPPSVPAL